MKTDITCTDDLLAEWDAMCHELPSPAVWTIFSQRLKNYVGGSGTVKWTKTTCTINGCITLSAPEGAIPQAVHRDFDKDDPRYLPPIWREDWNG